MSVWLTASVSESNVNVANNTSDVAVNLYANWDTQSWNWNSPTGSITIDGTAYSFSADFNDDKTYSGSQLLATKTKTVSHNSDGSKTVSLSAWYPTGGNSGTIYWNSTKVLTTIPRASDITAEYGTLGTAQTITIDRKSDSFTHTVTYECGTASGTICTKSTSESISFTPPLSLASQNTDGTNVVVIFKAVTYNGDTLIGEKTKTIYCAIPASVKPTVSIAASDAGGYLSTYGKYIKGLSTVSVELTTAGSYGSTITSQRTTLDGKTYSTASFTTATLSSSGDLTISATVTDSRSRNGTASKSISVYDYSAPQISAFSIQRSNSDGTINSSGSYLTVTFSSAITSLDSQNTATYVLKYKKLSASSYTSVTLSAYANNYAVSSGKYTFAADTASSYDVILTASDAFKSVTKSGKGSSIEEVFSIYQAGKGIAFGKTAEKENVFEIGENWTLEIGNRIDSLFGLTFIGNNPITTTADDTTANWKALGVGFAWYNKTGQLTNQPSQYGILINICGIGNEVAQTFIVQAAGTRYYRSGNSNGWSGTWKRLLNADENLNYWKYDSTTNTSYPGLARPDGTTTGYIRTTQNGFLPYKSGGSGQLGTIGWPFNSICGKEIYQNGTLVMNKPTLLWSNASPTSEFAAQTVTLSQSIEDFTHYSIVYRTYGSADRNLSVGLIPKTQTAHLQAVINYVSYRTCTISTNKATFTAATYQWTLSDSGSRGTNNFFCMPMYIYGWNL